MCVVGGTERVQVGTREETERVEEGTRGGVEGVDPGRRDVSPWVLEGDPDRSSEGVWRRRGVVSGTNPKRDHPPVDL